MNRVIHNINPVFDKNSKILILGSFPSLKSREAGFYYSHKQNRFWKVMEKIFNENIENNIDCKKIFLLKHNIALWDVIKSCDIEGSSDSSIKNICVNDINSILKSSSIKYVFTTGKKAYDLYKKYCFNNTKIDAIYLPSTSSSNIANYNLEDLISNYKIILKYL